VPPDRWRPTIAVKLSAGVHGLAAGLLAVRPGWWPGLLGAVLADHAMLGAAGIYPRTQLLGPTVSRLTHPGRAVALSFDDGPDPAVTPRVLDQLAAAGMTASFFCIGERALRHKALVRRIVAEGHAVENHTLGHKLHFAFLMGPALRREVVDAQSALADVAGVAPRWFRAPMGIRGPQLDPVLHRAGLHLMAWSRRGYDTRSADPGRVLGRLIHHLTPGDILLLHDGNGARRPGGDAVVLAVLPRLLDHLRDAGLAAVPLCEPEAASAAGPGSPASAGYAST
jgi:peptidoglycan/xylan/chitin deacetylase (PgdA/CDA1 family)